MTRMGDYLLSWDVALAPDMCCLPEVRPAIIIALNLALKVDRS